MAERSDPLYRGIYSTDASMYQMQPITVHTPVDRDEVLRVVRQCAMTRTPLLARGGGTSLTGQAINEAVVLDLSRYLNRVLELNVEQGWVRVEPGVVCAELNALLKPHGMHFAPDPATENRATIGGMIANNSAGMRSVRYGMTIDHVLELELALADGEVIRVGQLDRQGLESKCALTGREGEIYREMRQLIDEHAEVIRSRYPKVVRRSGGYALDALLDPDKFNLTKLMCGSEGTLGIVLEAKLKLSPLPKYSALCLAHFASLDTALRSAPLSVKAGASAAELIDGVIIRQARCHPLTRDICAQIQGEPAAILVIEVQGGDLDEVRGRAKALAAELSGLAYAAPLMLEASEIAAVWQMRSSALGLMTTVPGPRKPTPYIEDAAVPPENLADYVAEVLSICERYGQPVSLFGHASVGLVHIRPLHDLHRPEDVAQMRDIQAEVFPLVKKYGGSWSGEHGDGIVRGGYNRSYFGDDLYAAFGRIKRLFDPDGRMNPGKIIATPPMDSHLRYGPDYRPQHYSNRFRYAESGGLLTAAEQCSGVGACRKTNSGTMCPTYMATRDELHSTRGRANALRLALTGQLDHEGFASPLLAEAMSLCLACKACKAECPNGVDMARLKAEVLQAQHDRYGIPLRTRLFANMAVLGQLMAGPQAQFFNQVLKLRPIRWLLSQTLGLDADRPLPRFASERLSHWHVKRAAKSAAPIGASQVLLFNDSYTESFLPEVGRAAIKCLEAAGFNVILASVGESQRAAISLGLLDSAKDSGQKMLGKLKTVLGTDAPIVVCEPSSASALLDDLPALIDDQVLAKSIAGRVVMFDAFIEKGIAAGEIRFKWRDATNTQFVVHEHCHQKAVDGGRWTYMLLARIPGATVQDTGAGCCGMGGSLGYEKEHAELSRTIARQRLLPALEKSSSEAIVVTNGFSCRHQISDLSPRRPIHVAEALRTFIE